MTTKAEITIINYKASMMCSDLGHLIRVQRVMMTTKAEIARKW